MIRSLASSASLFARAMAALTIAACTGATPSTTQSDAVMQTVDLRRTGALEELRHANPHHFELMQEILVGLLEEPARAEGDWLQVNFQATDVDLTSLVLMTSYPPKQHLSFALEDVRYRLYLTRSDLVPRVLPTT